jgi:hypothetical protein
LRGERARLAVIEPSSAGRHFTQCSAQGETATAYFGNSYGPTDAVWRLVATLDATRGVVQPSSARILEWFLLRGPLGLLANILCKWSPEERLANFYVTSHTPRAAIAD